MITKEILEARGWISDKDRMLLKYDGFEFYFMFLQDGHCNFGVLEGKDDHTPMFEGTIKDEATLEQLFALTIYYDEYEEHEAFDLVAWLKERGWKGDEDECTLEMNDELATVYTCTSMGDNDFIITLEDEFTDDEPDYLYNGSVLNAAQAEMIVKATGIE
jgi:hypothetical protein